MKTFASFHMELRREDIAAHTLQRMSLGKSSLRTFQISFICLKVLYAYAFEAKDSAEKLLQRLFYESAEIIERCKH